MELGYKVKFEEYLYIPSVLPGYEMCLDMVLVKSTCGLVNYVECTINVVFVFAYHDIVMFDARAIMNIYETCKIGVNLYKYI